MISSRLIVGIYGILEVYIIHYLNSAYIAGTHAEDNEVMIDELAGCDAELGPDRRICCLLCFLTACNISGNELSVYRIELLYLREESILAGSYRLQSVDISLLAFRPEAVIRLACGLDGHEQIVVLRDSGIE